MSDVVSTSREKQHHLHHHIPPAARKLVGAKGADLHMHVHEPCTCDLLPAVHASLPPGQFNKRVQPEGTILSD